MGFDAAIEPSLPVGDHWLPSTTALVRNRTVGWTTNKGSNRLCQSP
jgi:hypothetical protein